MNNPFNILGKDQTEEKEAIEENSIMLGRHENKEISYKNKCNVNKMSIDKISKEIKAFQEDATKETEKNYNIKVNRSSVKSSKDNVSHSYCKECDYENKVLTGLMKDINRQNNEVKLHEGCYQILSSLKYQEYETEERIIMSLHSENEELMKILENDLEI